MIVTRFEGLACTAELKVVSKDRRKMDNDAAGRPERYPELEKREKKSTLFG